MCFCTSLFRVIRVIRSCYFFAFEAHVDSIGLSSYPKRTREFRPPAGASSGLSGFAGPH